MVAAWTDAIRPSSGRNYSGSSVSGARGSQRLLGQVNAYDADPWQEVKWALEAYATGNWSLNNLVEEVNRRGLQTTGNAKRAPGPLYVSHLHRLLIHPYYKGVVRYRGIENPGKHEPLVSPETWQRIQDVLGAHYLAGERHREHNHYLKGSVYCGNCHSRLIITNARNRHGKVYPYFVCSGRHQKPTDCTFRAILIETVEQSVASHYATQQLAPAIRIALEQALIEEFESFHEEVAVERKLLESRKQQLLAERAKLLQAHYAEAVPLDLLKTEQARIAAQLHRATARGDRRRTCPRPHQSPQHT